MRDLYVEREDGTQVYLGRGAIEDTGGAATLVMEEEWAEVEP